MMSYDELIVWLETLNKDTRVVAKKPRLTAETLINELNGFKRETGASMAARLASESTISAGAQVSRNFDQTPRLADSFGKFSSRGFVSSDALTMPNRKTLRSFAANAVAGEKYNFQLRQNGVFSAARLSVIASPEGGLVLMIPLISSAPIFTMTSVEARQWRVRYHTAQTARAAERRIVDQTTADFISRENTSRAIFSGFVSGLKEIRRVQLVVNLSGYSGLSRIASEPISEKADATIYLGVASQELLNTAKGHTVLMTPVDAGAALLGRVEAFNYGADLREMIVAALSDGEAARHAIAGLFGSQVGTEETRSVLEVPDKAPLSFYQQRHLVERVLRAISPDLFEKYLLARSITSAA